MSKRKFGWGGRDDDEDDELSHFADEENGATADAAANCDDGEVDPLDAFMAGIHEEVSKVTPPTSSAKQVSELDDEEDDPMETFLKARRDTGLMLAAEALNAGYDSDEEVYAAAKAVNQGSVDYDDEDNVIVTTDRNKIEPIPSLDHSLLQYQAFNKDFYEESPSISGMSEEEVAEYRRSLQLKVSGFDVPRPVKSFKDLGLDGPLMNAIAKQGYENPTPIQCQALPIGLSGRDVIGVAKTGSGKTAAFVIPMVTHVMDQEELSKGDGPIAVICAPTRELAQQIYTETRKFTKPYGLRVSGVFGGMSKLEQVKELKAGAEIVVATPGRLIDMLKMKVVNLFRTTYLVLDEADRMFEIGFEPQVRSIVGQIRPDRQTLLFSATMPFKVERLARDILTDPVRITAGEAGKANEDITQVVSVLPSDAEKPQWIHSKLSAYVDEGDVLVFASTKVRVEELEKQLQEIGFKVGALHGDKDQASRVEVLNSFKSGQFHVLVATDVAARGLDIKSIKTVVNYDVAKDIDTHVHRIGRTGRAGDKEGVAHTLVTQKEARFAGELVNSLIAAGQDVSNELMDVAMKDGRFRAQREGRKTGKGGRGKGARTKGKGGVSGGGGRGRGVRGVDYGMGIGYNSGEASHPKKPAGRGGFKQGFMSNPKTSFVPARGSTLPGFVPSQSGSNLRGSFVPASSSPLPGFVPSQSGQHRDKKAVLRGFVTPSKDKM